MVMSHFLLILWLCHVFYYSYGYVTFFTNPMVMSRFLLILWLCHPKVSLCFSNPFSSSSHNFADGPLLNPFFFSSHNFADGPLLGYNVTFFTNAMVLFFEPVLLLTIFLTAHFWDIMSDKKFTEVRLGGKSITTLSGHGGYREPARCP